ncbi:hypothetical protein TNCV_3760481 [Trichonephila clavipes]|nr:hypothetical protein TNCV_3760481 [Trichonephila clavipes]
MQLEAITELKAAGSLVVRASDSRPEGLGTGEYFPPFSSLAEIVEAEIEVVSPSIVPSGSFTELKSHCHLCLKQHQNSNLRLDKTGHKFVNQISHSAITASTFTPYRTNSALTYLACIKSSCSQRASLGVEFQLEARTSLTMVQNDEMSPTALVSYQNALLIYNQIVFPMLGK